jgi:hypothetical protein
MNQLADDVSRPRPHDAMDLAKPLAKKITNRASHYWYNAFLKKAMHTGGGSLKCRVTPKHS